jgi:uncharacterized protein YchJ
MRGGTMTRRQIDGGDPLMLLRDRPEDEGTPGFAVFTVVCGNRACECTSMWLEIHPLKRLGGTEIEVLECALVAEASSDGATIEVKDDAAGVVAPGTVDWIRERLREEDHRAWLAERWRRARGQIGDPAYPSGTPPERADAMASFWEVFRYEFDLTVVHDRRRYLADDQYCLNPSCACDEAVVQFIDLSDGAHVGHARASVRRPDAAEIEGGSLVRALWSRLLEDHGRKALRERYRRMRQAARARSTDATLARARVGRNEPCPCGSGKKYKRCCGAGTPNRGAGQVA